MFMSVRSRTSPAGTASCEGREAAQQSLEAGAHLDAGQLLAEALVDAVAEGQVTAGLAVDVQGVGVLEALRVAVGGQQRDDDGRSLADRLAAELDVLRGVAVEDVGDGQVAHELLDGVGHQVRVGAQLGQLLGVLQEREGAQCQHVGGGLVAGEQQQEGDADQLLDGEVVVAGQVGQDVVAGVGALARDQFGEVRGQSRRTRPSSPRASTSRSRNLAELAWKVSRSA